MTPTLLLTLTVVVTVVQSSTIPPETSGTLCQYEGQEYPEGSFQPDACNTCQCVDGEVICPIVDCFVTRCVEPVFDPQIDPCCPVCPNGENCRTPEGQVIPAGQRVQIADGIFCTCPTRPRSIDAICFPIVRP